jgi:hypothetical protein
VDVPLPALMPEPHLRPKWILEPHSHSAAPFSTWPAGHKKKPHEPAIAVVDDSQ